MLSRYRRCRFGYPRVTLTYTVRREPSGYFRGKLCAGLGIPPSASSLVFRSRCCRFLLLDFFTLQMCNSLLVFALGALALLIKGIFLMRKSSEGLGLSDQELADLSNPANRKRLPCFGVADNPGIDGDAPFTRTYADAPLQTLDQRDSGR